jgi:aspartyl-tRNA(Asn)/glutamyl-tRNA(Gln) amidotransferase subunit A
MPATDPALLSALELVGHFRRRTLSPVEAAEACLARIARLDAGLGAFARVDRDGARAAARAAEARWSAGRPLGPIDGVPATVKDLNLMRGLPTRRGSRTTEGNPPDAVDSPPVARLREAGAVILGKTTTPEFGWKGVTDNPLGEIARNPWDPSRTAGGSSGGAAVAAATGMGALHQGSDGGGSIRMPGGFTGIVGFKPTFGLVPTWPASPFGTVSHAGPMTRTVADAATMLDVLAGPDRRDWFALPRPGRSFTVGLEDGIRGCRVLASVDLGHARVDPEIRVGFAAALEALAEQGATLVERDPGIGDGEAMFKRHWYAAAAFLVGRIPAERRGWIDPGLAEIAAQGARVSATELQELQLERAAYGERIEALFAEVDLLVTPTLPIPAFAAGREVPEGGPYRRWIEWTPFTWPFNLGQQPAITVPCGFTAAGLPIGLQIVGPKYADALVLRAARAFEAARPQPMPFEPRPARDQSAGSATATA